MKDTAEPPQTRKRTWRSPQQRVRLIREYEKSEMTQTAFCREQGINPGTFSRWLRQQAPASIQPTFAEVSLPITPPADIEICLPNGTRVLVRHNDKPAELAKLIRGVAGC
jgi:transposase-like protein